MRKSLSMAARHEWWGQWWLPGEDDKKHGGRLVFDPDDGISLRLTGGFDHMVFQEPAPGVKTFSGETREFAVVYGEASGAVITLLHCTVSHSSGSLFGDQPTDQTLTAQFLLNGCLLGDPEDTEFVAVEAIVENLPHWSTQTAIKGEVQFAAKGSTGGTKATYEVGPVDASEAVFQNDRFLLKTPYSVPLLATTRTTHEVTLRDEPFFRVEFAEMASVREALKPTYELRDLLTLAIGRPCGVVQVRLFLPPDPSGYPEKHPYATRPIPVECLTRQSFKARVDDDSIPHHEVLFTLMDVPFSKVIPRWLLMRDKFGAAIDLVLGLRYNTNQYLETRTISAVAAAESFHRALDLEPPLADDVFKALRHVLRAAVSEEHRQLVSERFGRNEPSLKTRLLDLEQRLDKGVAAKILPDADEWAKRARDSRNTLAHQGSTGGGDLNVLYAVAEVTAAVVVLNLLTDLGITSEKIISKLGENNTLMHAVHLSEEFLHHGEDEPS